MSEADIHAQIANVNTAVRYSRDHHRVSFTTARWNRSVDANEVDSVLLTGNKVYIKLSSDVDSINPRSTRPRKYCIASFDPNAANAVFDCFHALVQNRLHDFRGAEHVFTSWGYDSKLCATADRFCIAMEDKFKVFARDDIGGVLLSRAGGGARTFDVTITLKNDGEYVLPNVDNTHYATLMDVLHADECLSSDSDSEEFGTDDCEDDEWHEGCTDDDSECDVSDHATSSEESEGIDSDCTCESDCD